MSSHPTLAVLILAYNEAETIAQVIAAVKDAVTDKYELSIIVVDDGSTDQTRSLAEQAGALVLSHGVNRGVGNAFHTGLEAAIEASVDMMVNIDADGQFAPTDIPRLLEPIVTGSAAFVSGDRFIDPENPDQIRMPENMPPVKYWGNLMMARFISFIAGQRFTDVSCGFRAYSRKAMMMLNLTGKFTYTQETFIDLAVKDLEVTTVPISVKYFPGRRSRVADNLVAYGFKTLKIILRSFRDYRPMLFFYYLSLPFLMVGLAAGAFITSFYLQTGAFSPFKSVAFTATYLLSLTLILWLAGFVADMFVRVRMNQERILYLLRRRESSAH